jgi:gluconolactonase
MNVRASPNATLRSYLGRSLEHLIGAGVALVLARDLRCGEGPAWLSDEACWIFSDIPNNRILQWSQGSGLSVYRDPSNFANGNFVCANGDLLTCEHESRRVVRTARGGSPATVCDRYQGHRLNSPNDLVEASDGSVWFSDPSYGILSDIEGRKALPEQDRRRVYRVDANTAQVSSEIDSLDMPNGLTFSPDERLLYVADSGADQGPEVPFNARGPRDVYAFAIEGGRVRGPGRRVRRVAAGVPDGMRCDAAGHLWIGTGGGIECTSASGDLLGSIPTDEPVTNLCFGGEGGGALLVTLVSKAVLIGA